MQVKTLQGGLNTTAVLEGQNWSALGRLQLHETRLNTMSSLRDTALLPNLLHGHQTFKLDAWYEQHEGS